MNFRFSNSLISNDKVGTMTKTEPSNEIILPIEKKSTQVKYEAFSIKTGNSIEIMLPITTYSEANGGLKKTFVRNGKTTYKTEHWTEKNKRHKRQKGHVRMFLNKFSKDIKLPCLITLTRFAPKKLDKFDNLPMAFKWILDAICEVITGDYRPGLADNTIEDDIDVIYKQIISKEYWIHISITF
jgi:hypothetical protein